MRHSLLKYVLSVIPRGIELLQGVAESQRAETQVLGAPHLPRLIEAHLHGAEAHFDDRVSKRSPLAASAFKMSMRCSAFESICTSSPVRVLI